MKEKSINVIELRNYLLKPNVREDFAGYFSENFVDSQNILGGNVLGQFFVSDMPDNFFWVRGFENMQTRSRFLNEFYYGDVWKTFGSKANEMMIDSDNVYLLKPLNKSQIFRKRPFMRINFCFATDGKIAELINLFESKIVTKMSGSNSTDVSLWLSELAENDFPKLPAFQYENLLVMISGFADEIDFNANTDKLNSTFDFFGSELEHLIAGRESLNLI